MLEKILRERGSLYKEVSDLEVKVTEKSIKNTVAEILKTLQEEAEFGKA